MKLSSKIKSKQEKVNKQGTIGKDTLLGEISPKFGYYFFSDYYTIDKSYATILTVFHRQSSDRKMSPFWGINLIPRLPANQFNVSTHLFNQVNQASETWVKNKQRNSDNLNHAHTGSSKNSNSKSKQRSAGFRNEDLDIITDDLGEGDSYHFASFKLMIKATDLSELDRAVEKINGDYHDYFNGMDAFANDGEQYDELKNLYHSGEDQVSKSIDFTSSELAGSYNIVTQGINDPYGDYVGIMRGDVNNPAVLWDMEDFKDRAIIAANDRAETIHNYKFPTNTRGSAMWGVKLAQNSLINNHRVVNLVLNNSRLDKIGIDLSDITTTIDMNHGAINPFEMFGDTKDELTIFSAQMNKIKLMFQQIQPNLDSTDLNDNLGSILENFYIKNNMWVKNAQENRESVSVVGLKHQSIPLMENFLLYLENQDKKAFEKKDNLARTSIQRLRAALRVMLNENGDIFNVFTESGIDDVKSSPQITYDFSSLIERGKEVAMAQFVNAIGFAVSSLQAGDILEIYGADLIDKKLFDYVSAIFESLRKKEVRVVFLYDSVDSMLQDHKMNQLTEADWTLTSYMSNKSLNEYQNILETTLPSKLADVVVQKDAKNYFLRRDSKNIVFSADPIIDENGYE